jgi:UDP-4-amino-4,6-dideoxy-N-acetyl-beta-L-altrosamine transaminase
MTGTFLPYGRQTIDDDDIAAVAAVLKSDALTNGPAVDAFEHALVEVTGAGDVVACSSGTTALHLAVLGLGIQPGDQVIVPTLTFLATANCARYVGAEVVFADVDPETGLMAPRHLEDAIARTRPGAAKVAIPVHLNGQCCDMEGLKAVADRHGISLIEDACHAVGSTYPAPSNDRVTVGSSPASVAACLSFHPVKTIAMGEGGAVTTNDPKMAAAMRRLRSHGMERTPAQPVYPEYAQDADGSANPWFYEMTDVGWNFRATDIQCALGLSQLKKLDRFIARRQELVARYDAALRPFAPLIRPVARVGGDPAWHLYVALIDFAALGKSRAVVMRALSAAGIGTQVHYFPVHLQPYYQERYGKQDLPGANAYYARCLSLPLFPAMADADVDRVVAALAQIVK